MTPAATIAAAMSVAVACSTSGTPTAGTHRSRSLSSASARPTSTSSSSPVSSSPRLRATVVGRLPVALSRTVAVPVTGGVVLLGGLTSGDVTTDTVTRVALPSVTSARVGSLGLAVHDASGARLGAEAVVFGGGAAQEEARVQALPVPVGHVGGVAHAIGALPQGRSDSAAVTVDGTSYVVGGFDGTRLVPGILATADGRTFRVVGRLQQPVRYPAVAVSGGDVWVFGGQLATTAASSTGPQSDDIQRFDPRSGRTTIVAHLPSSLGHAMAFTLDGRLFVAGGRHMDTPTRRIWAVDPLSGRLRAAGRLPFAFSDAAVVESAAAVYLIGGETSGPLDPLRTVVRVTTAFVSRS